MRKAWIVARHEFLTTVKRWGFLLVTFGLPAFMLGVIGLSIGLQTKSIESEQGRISSAKVGLVDEAGIVTLPPPAGRDWRTYVSRDEARKRMGPDGIEIVAVLPPDYLETGRVGVLTTLKPSIFNLKTSFIRGDFEEWLARNVLKEVDVARLRRARHPAIEQPPEYLTIEGDASVSERPEDYVKRMASGIGFFFLMFLSISVAGGYLIQGMADEKENRVLEMVISSMTPTQLMAGKLAGLGAVGLLQIAVWSTLGVATAVSMAVTLAVNPALFAICGVFYLLGYILFGCLLLGIGSLGSNQREATQYTWILSMISVSPVFVWMSILSEPQGVLARVFSYIPLTASTTMMLRCGVDPKGTAAWEIALAMAVLAASCVGALRLSAKLYRVGLLLYGKRPTIAEVWRWLRE